MPRGGKRSGTGRPPLPEGEHRVQIGIRLAPHLKEKLDKIAEARGTTITKVIESLIENEPHPEG